MFLVFYAGPVLERAGMAGAEAAWAWYGESTFVAPEVLPVAEESSRTGGGNRHGASGREDEILRDEEDAVMISVVTWTVHHA